MAQASDTLHVRVTSVQVPMEESTFRSTFAEVAPVRNIYMAQPYTQPNQDVIAIVRFNSPGDAARALAQRNNRCVFNGCNLLNINYTRWESFVAPPAPQPQFIEGPYANGTAGAAVQPQQRFGMVGAQPVAMQMMPTAAAMGAPMQYMQAAPQPQPLMMVPGGFASPAAGMMTPPVAAQMAPLGMASVAVGQPMMRGRGGGMGSVGRGRGIGGGMPMGGGLHIGMPAAMPGFAIPPGMTLVPTAALRGGMMGGPAGGSMIQPRYNTVFASIGLFPTDSNLLRLFTILEVFGAVVYLRRGFNNPQTVTAKMASQLDMQNLTMNLRNCPIDGATISAKPFSEYTEREWTEPTGEPSDPATTMFDFTMMPHRRPHQRSRCHPSRYLKIGGFDAAADIGINDIADYLQNAGFAPQDVSRVDDERFVVRVTLATVEEAVACLLQCHGAVCDLPDSYISFFPDPENQNNNKRGNNSNNNGGANGAGEDQAQVEGGSH